MCAALPYCDAAGVDANSVASDLVPTLKKAHHNSLILLSRFVMMYGVTSLFIENQTIPSHTPSGVIPRFRSLKHSTCNYHRF